MAWVKETNIKGPKGDKGDKGDPGDPATVEWATVTDLVTGTVDNKAISPKVLFEYLRDHYRPNTLKCN